MYLDDETDWDDDENVCIQTNLDVGEVDETDVISNWAVISYLTIILMMMMIIIIIVIMMVIIMMMMVLKLMMLIMITVSFTMTWYAV